jgi:hypothetical protein
MSVAVMVGRVVTVTDVPGDAKAPPCETIMVAVLVPAVVYVHEKVLSSSLT